MWSYQQVAHLLPFMLALVALYLPSSKISSKFLVGTILSNLDSKLRKSNFLSISSFKILLFISISFSAYLSPHLNAFALSDSDRLLIWTSFAVEGEILSKLRWYSSLIYLKIYCYSFSYLSLTICLCFSNFSSVSGSPRSVSAGFLWRA